MKPRAMGRWAPAIVAGVIFGAVGVAAAVSGGGGNKAGAGADQSQFVPVQDESSLDPLATEPAVSAPDVVVDESTSVPKTLLKRALHKGLVGTDVKRMQQRLIDLGYDPGKADGNFGEKTRSAVWAFEKLIMGVPVGQTSGKVTPTVWDRMQDNIVITPKRPKATRTHLEVYLPQQVAILFVDNKVRLITHISSGTGQPFQQEVTIDPGEDGNETGTVPIQALVNGVSFTPGGVFKFTRRWDPLDAPDGWRDGRLGRMYKPIYFNYGLAVHGSGKVPDGPASHGCIRIPMHIADYFPDLVAKGDQVFVFDGKQSPESYGRQKPHFDQVDIVTTTTEAGQVTTTTKPKTTTTVKPTTTTKPTTTAKTTTTKPSTTTSG